MDTFGKYLGFSLKHISPEIISEKNKLVMLNSLEFLPDTFSYSVFGYEKKLASEEGKADLAVSGSVTRPAPFNFNSSFTFPGLKKLADEDPAWKRLEACTSRWKDVPDAGGIVPEVICLEFDFDSLLAGNTTPSLFLGIEKGFIQDHPENKNQLFNRLNVFNEGIGKLSGSPLNADTAAFMRETSEKIFPEYSLFQTGIMLSRPDSPVRVCLKRFTGEKLLCIAGDLFPPSGMAAEVKEIVEKYGMFFDHFALSLDVLRGVIVKWGVECYYNKKRQPAYEKRWQEVLALLVKENYCSGNMMNEILNFPRKVATAGVPELMSAPYPPEFYAQALHHLKFTPGAGRENFAKVYLWAGFGRKGMDT